ncbi:MAG TPA: D-alanyl-D-alanine carboxypeptidase family protein [Mesorhizobium sp.]|nr:D-alanyl-D-alanine carboxypeptidase family protein [Mesorhizobium sp.]
MLYRHWNLPPVPAALTLFSRPFAAPFRAAAFALAVGALSACSTAQTLDVSAPPPVAAPISAKHAAIVVDGSTGRTLYESASTESRYPASLTKMMTLYLLFEAMDRGQVSPATPLPVSAFAASQPPSKLGVKAGHTIAVESAIQSLATKSANDVAVVVAEYLGGSEAQFASMMTARARSLGMSGTTFRNASGLPDAEQRTTARDMALLGMALRKRFPQYYGYFSARTFAYNGRAIRGHNHILSRVEGADGIKTGYIRASGFNVVSSVNRDGRRLVVTVMGGESAKARDDYAEMLIEHYLPRAKRGG